MPDPACRARLTPRRPPRPAAAVREGGFLIVGAIALVDHETGTATRLEAAGVPFRAVFTPTEFAANRADGCCSSRVRSQPVAPG